MEDSYAKNQRRARRHERKRQQLGSPAPVCASCGCMDVVSLTGVPFSQLPAWVQRKLGEQHHLARRAAGDWQVLACLNCHAVFSDDQYDWDPRLLEPQIWTEQLAAFLQGLADWFRQLGKTLTDLAEALQQWVERLLSMGRPGAEDA